MRMKFPSVVAQPLVSFHWIEIFALLFVVQPAASSATVGPTGARPGAAVPQTCAPDLISFERDTSRPPQLLLSARPDLSLGSILALRVTRPELFRFRTFYPGEMAGILSNGCAVEFWWSRRLGPYQVEEIRILGPVESVDRYHAYLRSPPRPEPSRHPSFEGYRHVMSGALSPAGLSYIGLWRRSDGTPGSLIAAYDADGEPVIRLGTTEWAYDRLYADGTPMHAGLYGFTLVDEPEGSEPLYFVTYDWTYRNPWQPRHRGGR
jgi:hypothetical protein